MDTVKIPLSETIGVVPNSWYAWTADGFCASAKENKIYWNGQPKEGSWFTGYQICGYDIDKKQFFQLIENRTGIGACTEPDFALTQKPTSYTPSCIMSSKILRTC